MKQMIPILLFLTFLATAIPAKAQTSIQITEEQNLIVSMQRKMIMQSNGIDIKIEWVHFSKLITNASPSDQDSSVEE